MRFCANGAFMLLRLQQASKLIQALEGLLPARRWLAHLAIDLIVVFVHDPHNIMAGCWRFRWYLHAAIVVKGC